MIKLESKPKVSNSGDESNEASIFMYNKPELRNDVDVYIDGPVRELSYYRNLLHYMRNMEEHDSLRLWITSPGGYYDSAVQICSAMRGAQGNVQVIVTGEAASAGSLIALAAPNLVLGEEAYFMCHAGSYGTGSQKQNDVRSFVDFTQKQLTKTMVETYEGFMTKEEIDLMLLGKDYYFDFEESTRRLEVRHQLQMKQLKGVNRKKKVPIVQNDI